MSWKPEMLVDGKWYDNALRFATMQEAYDNGRDLLMRWYVPTDHRATESTDPVNYSYANGKLVHIPTNVPLHPVAFDNSGPNTDAQDREEGV